jgi:hypothetical protein
MNQNQVIVLQYNILSSNLADQMQNEIKDGKKVYDESFMNNNYRWNKLSKYFQLQINTYAKQNLIICLQEVSEDMLVQIASLFASLNYKYINVQHGRIFNGNMGVFVGYPSNLNIVKSEFFTVGKHIIISDNVSSIAASKTNIAILLILENPLLNFKFGIVTYHMPFDLSNLQVGLIHVKVLYKKIVKFMDKINWIWAGDFNFLPKSITYEYLISKTNCVWKDYLKYYPITNYAYIKGREFSGCIDYIFYSKSNLKCKQLLFDKINSIQPSQTQISDHISIIAIFEFGIGI